MCLDVSSTLLRRAYLARSLYLADPAYRNVDLIYTVTIARDIMRQKESDIHAGMCGHIGVVKNRMRLQRE